jgi:hypothetical protein
LCRTLAVSHRAPQKNGTLVRQRTAAVNLVGARRLAKRAPPLLLTGARHPTWKFQFEPGVTLFSASWSMSR